jgi:O-antigen/teichoic acid export membrane protein
MCGSDQKMKLSCVILVLISFTYSFVNSAAIQVIKHTSKYTYYTNFKLILTYLLTYLLTQWSQLEKLTTLQLVKKFPALFVR